MSTPERALAYNIAGVVLLLIAYFTLGHVFVKTRVSPRQYTLFLLISLSISLALGVFIAQGGLRQKCDIVMYSMVGCGYCDRAKVILDSHKTKYKVVSYTKGAGEVPTMPDGEKPTQFPTFWVNNKRRRGDVDVAALARSCAAK